MEIGGLERPEGQRTVETDERGACLLPALCPSNPLTQAAGAIQAAGKTTGTGAHVAPGCVGAVTPRAEARHTETLVHICVDKTPVKPGPHQP